MSRELASWTDGEQNPGTDTAIRDYVQALLRQYRADKDDRQAAIRSLEKAGRRIVTGGQTESDQWEIGDWRSGDALATGSGGVDDYDASCRRLDPDGTWVHIDSIPSELTDTPHPGLPPSLADALQDWLGSMATPDEDVAQFVGWSVEEVARHREED